MKVPDLIQATAEWRTEQSRKYLVQLCKHFSHKVEVTYTETHGECRFSCGTAILNADGDRLKIVANAESLEQLTETESVIERHLVRFAFRENLQALEWQIQERAT